MNIKNILTMKFLLHPLSATLLMASSVGVFAKPGELSDVPLYSRGSAEPNIMFVLDSSGSMNKLLFPVAGYDSSDPASFSCAKPVSNRWYYDWRYSGYNEIQYRVRIKDGSVEFRVVSGNNIIGYTYGAWRTWGRDANCFDESKKYTAWLYANSKINHGQYYKTGSSSSDYRRNLVPGHFLNWFFSQEKTGGGYEADKFLDAEGQAMRSKVDIRRTDVMKTAAKDLVSSLSEVRIGFMQFNGGKGAKLLSGLTSLTEDNKDRTLGVIDKVGAGGTTPLAEAFTGVGRYFVTGYEENNLSYIKSDGVPRTAKGKEIFAGSSGSNPVIEWNAVTKPTATTSDAAIQYYCQKNFMVALTDGEPTWDNDISRHLVNYDYACDSNVGGCTDDQMDDVIKALYDIDLRPDMVDANGDPVINNITSYLIGFANTRVAESALMKNAGALGGGGLYTANNAAELKLTFNSIIDKVQKIVGSSSSVAFNTTALEADSVLFSAEFDSSKWSGNLKAWELDDDGNIATTSSWGAASKLDPSNRVMLTYKEGSEEGEGVAFTIEGVGTAHNDDLNRNGDLAETPAVVDHQAAKRIAYLRGDRTEEGVEAGKFRQRDSLLGDIVNSTPEYVGAPDAGWSSAEFDEAKSYAAFKKEHSTRTPVVYVGANDGFVHGFNASVSESAAGQELIAYSPAALLSTHSDKGLHALTSQFYAHKFYVDGTPTSSDVYINSSWQTVLVGGLGAGGKGYYALEVTNPAAFNTADPADIVLWEFTDTDNPNLGYTFSRPQIGRMANGKWAAIFGNGYNSSTGDAGIFIVYLKDKSYTYISTGTAHATDPNGMSTPAIVDVDLDGTIDRIYAGDLKGQMWAFDVSSSSQSDWDVAGTGTVALFTAPKEQAITAAPRVARNTDNASGAFPNVLVTFGTGQYLVAEDTADRTAGAFYAVSDNGTYGLGESDLALRILSDPKIKKQTDGTTKKLRKIGGDDFSWETKSGWYIPLDPPDNTVDGGERVITRAEIKRHVLFFNTLIPTGQVCAAGGYGSLMSVDLWSGLAPDEPVFDANGDGKIDSKDKGYVGEQLSRSSPGGSGFIGGKQITPRSDGTRDSRDFNLGNGEGRAGRLSWEEITPF